MREHLKTASLFLFACLISVVSAEILVRMFLSAPQRVTIERSPDLEIRQKIERSKRYRVELSESPEQGRGYFYIMTQTGRRLRANTQVIIDNHHLSHRKIEIKTNSLGYRNPEIDSIGKRILFLGDSIVMGDYLNEQDTFVRQIGELAKKEEKNWNVINAGVSGISLKNELSILTETGLSTVPNTVVLSFYLNDFQESPGVYIQDATFPFFKDSWLIYYLVKTVNYLQSSSQKTKIQNIRHVDGDKIATVANYKKIYEEQNIKLSKWESSFKKNNEHSSTILRENPQLYNEIIANFRDWGGAWSPEMWDYIYPLFTEFKQLSEKHDFQLLILCFPVRLQVESEGLFNYPQRQLSKLSQELDIPMFDILPVLRKDFQSNTEDLFYDQCHHTPYGNRIISKAVYRFISNHI